MSIEMTSGNKPELQYLWDELLLDAWRHHANVQACIFQFAYRIGRDEGLATVDFLLEGDAISLDRWPKFEECRKQIKDYVYTHSQQMSDYLWAGGELQPALDVIGNFRWRKELGRKKRRSGAVSREIKARALSETWSTVK
jgi:hypothetical protein